MDIKNIKKLPPEERLKRLKELEEERKKEIEEAEKLVKESFGEIEEKEKKKLDIPIEQVKALNQDSLLTESEKQVFRTKHFETKKTPLDELEEEKEVKPIKIKEPEESLEESLGKEEITDQEKLLKSQQQYKAPGAEKPGNLYEMANDLGQKNTVAKIYELKNKTDWDQQDQEDYNRIKYEVNKTPDRDKLQEMYKGNLSEQMLDEIDSARTAMKKLTGMYKN